MGSKKSIKKISSVLIVCKNEYIEIQSTIYKWIVESTVEKNKADVWMNIGTERVIDILKNKGYIDAFSIKDVCVVCDHIQRSHICGGYTQSEIVSGYDLTAEAEEKKRIEKNGIHFYTLSDGFISTKKTANGSVSIGIVTPNRTGIKSRYEVKIPSKEMIEKYYNEIDDEYIGQPIRKVPYAHTYSGVQCPICLRYSGRAEKQESINTYFGIISDAIPENPLKHISVCHGCIDFFDNIYKNGKYWCPECGQIEDYRVKYACAFSKESKNLKKLSEKKKDLEKKETELYIKERKIKSEWGI